MFPRSLLASLVLAAHFAAAQTTPVVFDLERMTLEPGSSHALTLGTGDGLRAGRLNLSLMAHGESNPLIYVERGQRVGAIVSARATAVLGVAVGLFDWLELGAQVPIVMQRGDDLTGSGLTAVAGAGVGAPLLRARLTLLRQDLGAPVDLGISLTGTLPLGSTAALARDPASGFQFSPRVGAGHSFGSVVRVGAELGTELRESPTLVSFSTRPDPSLGALLVGGLTATTLGTGLRGGIDVRASATTAGNVVAGVEVLAHVRWPVLSSGVELVAAAGPGFGSLAGTPSFRALVGASWAPLGGSACREGGGYRLADCPLLDRDGDGVPNRLDACPEFPGDPQLSGCPPPAQAKLEWLHLRDLGPLPRSGDLSDTTVDLAAFLHQQIHFEFDSARIALDPEALDEATELLAAVPDGVITIEGHTDATGPILYNATLSLRRAEAVRVALIARGIDPARLVVAGRGPDEPVASNALSTGRAQNRRVRFLIDRPHPQELTHAF